MIDSSKHSHPTAIVVFGGTGNLTKTKLIPALFDLYRRKMLPQTFVIIGLSRKSLSHEEYRAFVREQLEAKGGDRDMQEIVDFCSHIQYISGSSEEDSAYEDVRTELEAFDSRVGVCTNKLFYLAVTPNLYSGIFEKLKQSGVLSLCDSVGSWSRLLVEKPFGRDLETAKALEERLCQILSEEQIYRIDHYLAKDAIENITSLRFANSILSDSWKGTKIEAIELRLFESQDVSTRGSFYEEIGALRDVGQNHMLQMLALLTMHQAKDGSAASVRASRLAALTSLTMHGTDVAIRGQYKGYRDTVGVAEGSETETYFKIETHLDSELWEDVKVTLESGKALHTSLAEAVVTFRPTDACTCDAESVPHAHKNILRIRFSPEQSIRLTMWVKEPGFGFVLRERELTLTEEQGGGFRSPEAYERVLYDCIVGDQTRFVSGEEVVAAWEFITPILESFKNLPLHVYEPGSEPPVV